MDEETNTGALWSPPEETKEEPKEKKKRDLTIVKPKINYGRDKPDETSWLWAMIVYLDSMPDDYMKRMEDTGMSIAVSPLQDKDKWEPTKKNPVTSLTIEEKKLYEAGELYKKPHHHLLIGDVSKHTRRLVLENMIDALGSDIPKKLIKPKDPKQSYLYLTHESRNAKKKGKHRYDPEKIVELNKFDLDAFEKANASDKEERAQALMDLRDSVEDFIMDYGITSATDARAVIRYLERQGDTSSVISWDDFKTAMTSKGVDSMLSPDKWLDKLMLDQYHINGSMAGIHALEQEEQRMTAYKG